MTDEEKAKLNSGQYTDIDQANIEEWVPDKLIKVYPYEMVNTSKGKAFIQNNSVSIIAISQDNLEGSEFHNLKVGEFGDLYFEMFASVVGDMVLTNNLATSTFGQELRVESSFSAISNQFINSDKFKPMMVTVGAKYDDKEYRAGRQIAYFIHSIQSAGNQLDLALETEITKHNLNKDVIVQFNLDPLSIITSNYNSVEILFTTNTKFNHNVETHIGETGISIGFESGTLIHSLTGKGYVKEYDGSGDLSFSGFGDVDFISEQPFAPFKFTPTSVKDKLTMFADWWDYDAVLPFIYAEKFKAGASLDTVITNADDLKMVQDMISISAGYASSWASIPVLTSGTETGKINPNFRVGYSGIKVSVIAGKDPIKVIDGIYEKHLRDFPAFITDPARFQPAKEIINALSRYIYSSYSIGRGQNSYNMAYLPWYLEPYINTPITFDKKVSITNPDKGTTGNVDTYVLDDTVKFQIKTLYFNDKFSSKVPVQGTSDLLLPSNVNMSNQILLQTDRKLALPEVPYHITTINKLPLPGDIDIRSSQDLKYLWYLPIKEQSKFEEFMLNKLTAHTGVPIGTDITISVPRTPDGTIWNQQQVNEWVLSKQPGTLKTPSVITTIQKNVPIVDFPRDYGGFKVGAVPNSLLIDFIMDKQKYVSRESIVITSNTLNRYLGGLYQSTPSIQGTYTYTIGHTEFTNAIVTITSTTNGTYSFQERQVLFAKQDWYSFLNEFGIVPGGINIFDFKEKKRWIVKELSEITISSVWGNKIVLYTGTSITEQIEIPLFNKDDETISTQKINFT